MTGPNQGACDRPVRVLHALEPGIGGVPNFVLALTDSQTRRQNPVCVLGPPGLGNRLQGGEFTAWSLRRERPHSYPQALTELKNSVEAWAPDVVHLHSFFAGLIGRVGGYDVPIVYQPHAWAFLRNRPVDPLVRTWERRAARRTAAVAAVSPDEAEAGRRARIDAPMFVTHVPVDLERFRRIDPGSLHALRQALELPEQDVVLCAGRISRQKGQDALVRWWASHPPESMNLVLVGEGDSREIEGLAGKELNRSIFVLGFRSNIEEYLAAADVVVQPSRWEGLSMVVAESMACGTPVVTTDVSGAATALGEGSERAGAIVAQGDMSALVSECARRLEDERLRTSEGLTGRRRAHTLFSAESVETRVKTAYCSVLRCPCRNTSTITSESL